MADIMTSIIESEYFFPVLKVIVGIILAVIAIELIPVVLSIITTLLATLSVALAPLMPYLPIILLIVGLFVLPEEKVAILASFADIIPGLFM